MSVGKSRMASCSCGQLQVIAIEGRSSEYRRIADSGNALRFHFCLECGSTVYYLLEQSPEVIAVPVGAFADASITTK